MKHLLKSLLFIFATMIALPAFADDPCKNLFDISKAVSGDGVTNNGDGTLTSTRYPAYIGQLKNVAPGLKVGDIVVLSMTTNGAALVYLADTAQQTWVSGQSITITQAMLDAVVGVYSKPDGGAATISNIQIERGSTATTYQPYTPLCTTCDGTVKYHTYYGPLYNNLVPTPASASSWSVSASDGTVTYDGDEVTFTVTQTPTGNFNLRGSPRVTITPGHILYITTDFYVSKNAGLTVSDTNSAIDIINTFQTVRGNIVNEWQTYKAIARAEMNMFQDQIYPQIVSAGWQVGDYYKYKNYQVYDLTEIFGSGNEPNTLDAIESALFGEQSDDTTYCEPFIKIATTAYNAAAFAPVEAALESAVTTIKDVVANTIVQADAIQNLQDTKQTMPDANGTNGTCPRFRQCLLVETEDGAPQWFQIADPVYDLVSSLKNNKVNSSGETTNDTFAANGKSDPDSRYYKGYPAMRLKTSAASSSVNTRQFSSTLLNGVNGGQYRTLGDQEWAVTWGGDETGTQNSFLPGAIYGTSRCVKTSEAPTTTYAAKVNPGTDGWTTIENSEPLNDLENIESYVNCYCKMTGVGLDGMITPVRDSSQAPWVFYSARGAAGDCASACANRCADGVRDDASFRQSLMGWALE